MMCFVDTEYENEPNKRIPTTGFYFKISGGAVVYRSKNKSINALISTEAKLIAAVIYAKTSGLLRSMELIG